MDLRETVALSLVGLTSHKLRTLLTMLGIIFGVAAVIAMLSIGEGAKQESLEQIRQMGIVDQDFGDAFLVPRRGVHEHRVVAARQPDCHGTCHTDVTSSSQNDRACRADDADHAYVPGIE